MKPVTAQDHSDEHGASHEVASTHDHHSASTVVGVWEGSAEGIAYSEFNHRLAGFFILLIGFSEMSQALRSQSVSWARMLLPSAMGTAGIFLLIWSDHEAWPIGSLSFRESFFGNDQEIVQHKIYGALALTVALIEIVRQSQRRTHAGWIVPLPLFAIIGGLMLFGHSHGLQPAAHKITLHHAVMGVMAIAAGSSKLIAGWTSDPVAMPRSRWELLSAGLILLIGAQLLAYSE